MNSIRIVDYGPKTIHPASKFNLTSNGNNAIWIKVEEKLGNPSLIFKGNTHRISPAYDREKNLISFEVSPAFTSLSGTIYFQIHDIMRDIKSEFLEVHIEDWPNINDNIDCIRNDLIELASIKSKSYIFHGLGLATAHSLPWQEDPNVAQHLSKVHNEIENHFEFSLGDNTLNGKIESFFWRSATIYYLANLTINQVRPNNFKFLECGVGDGISAYIVMSLLEKGSDKLQSWETYLCDLWQDSKKEKLGLEKNLEGVFDLLSIKRTKYNLEKFSSNSTYIHGELPQSLDKYENELNDLSLIHIDLNFADPTIRCVERLYPKLLPGGVILFDDYGWSPHAQTREALKEFVQNNGTFIMYPTGQAALFK